MLKAGIVGCGSIGAMKANDIDSPSTKYSLTHAHAIYNNPNIGLAWVHDADFNKMKSASLKWDTRYTDPKYKANAVDIIVIATPTETHLSMIEKICLGRKIREATEEEPEKWEKVWEYKPKIIVIEKPVGVNIYECNRINYLTSQSGIQLVVNYTRRWSSILAGIVSMIQKQEIQNIIFQYTRGFIRDGSHAIDMINWLAGAYIEGTLLSHKIIDYHESDPTYGAITKHRNCPLALIVPMDGREYDIFEMIVNTKTGKWFFTDHFSKVYYTEAKREEVYSNDYKSLPDMIQDCTCYKTEIESALDNLYLFVDRYLNNSNASFTPSCGIKEAMMVHNVIDRLMLQKEILK
jgi:hypothetical protein